jgi:hypothetical protein
MVRQWHGHDEVILLFNFSRTSRVVGVPVPVGTWQQRLNSAGQTWGGQEKANPANLLTAGEPALSLPPTACLVYQRQPNVEDGTS